MIDLERRPAVRLGAFGVALAAVFAVSLGVGRLTGELAPPMPGGYPTGAGMPGQSGSPAQLRPDGGHR